MAEPATAKSKATTDDTPSKQELQRQMARTRASVSETVDEIKETVSEQVAVAKQTVVGVLDYREQFQNEPLVWSLGALSAGFALGYAVGYAHKFSTKKAGNSQLAQFTDRMVDELSKVGQSLVVPALGTKMREFFGLDFEQLLQDMGGTRKRTGRKRTSGTRRTKSRARKPRKAKSRK